MKNFYFTRLIVLTLFFTSANSLFSQTTINYENFESGSFPFTLWNDGGGDCSLNSGSILSGNDSANLQDNSGSSSSMYTSNIDLTSYASVDITFDFRAIGFDSGHDFFIEFSNDGGASWNGTEVARYIRGTDFNNDTTYTNQTVSITNGGTYTFTNISRFRFRSDANNNNDDVYIDEVLIEGHPPTFSNVTVSVNWPNWSSENWVDIYAPDGTLLTSINNGYTGCCNDSYSTTVSLGCLENLNNYYFTMYDTYGDGWNGADNITISTSGGDLVNQNGDIADANGETVFFNVNGGVCASEIDITGNNLSIPNGNTAISTADNTDFGDVEVASSNSRTFVIQNTGGADLNLTGASPYVTISGTHQADFSISTAPNSLITGGGNTTFIVTFTPAALGLRTATLTIANDDADENPYTFDIQGTGAAPLTEAPGGITTSLALWLNDTDGLSYTDGQSISMWSDQGRGSDATVNIAGHEPTYRDNPTKNINFNPVVEFDNAFSTFTLDNDYSYDDTSTQFLEGSSGLYTQDMFIVVIPDETIINNSFGFMDVFCGDANPATNAPDATGIGFGDYTGRITGESISYAYDSFDNTDPGDGYAVHDGPTGGTYSNVAIINARNNTAVTQQELYYNANNIGVTQNDIPEFMNVNDSKFWIGRSEGWEASLNGRIAEIITFSSRLSDTDLTDERNRVQSYLAIKYGITLGVNGTSQDYVDSDGTVIWDQLANTGYNYNIAGIGRDDNSKLNQKQSSSINNATDATGPIEGILTIGLTDIYDTNNINKSTNTNTLNNKDYLVWGDNNASLDATPSNIAVDMSSGIPGLSTPVSFMGMQRVWKVVENGSDIGKVKVSIPQNTVRNISPPGDYLMFVSDTGIFDPTADYRVMTINGSDLETTYDFDGTKYITFGYAPQTIVERSVFLDGVDDFIDSEEAYNLNNSEFTISAWIKRDSGSGNTSILSKRDNPFTEGYDLKINFSGQLEFIVNNGTAETFTGATYIPENEWHHVAMIFNSGDAYFYIDGILDQTGTISAPAAVDQNFLIGAASKTGTTSHYRGNVDEVRIWDRSLSLNQLRFIMNQEIVENSNLVSGKVIPNSITKNEVNTIPWSDLAGYYPMSIYTYTNVRDESGNGNQGALRNLNTVDYQTAPIPYVSENDGDWNTTTTWLNGSTQRLPGSASLVDTNITVDWNIAITNHDVTMENWVLPSAKNQNRQLLALFVESNKLTLNGGINVGHALTVSHYLKLDGKIDLEGESQLIQTTDSDLDPTSSGILERDQQGTQDLYTYNYWSSPVGLSNATTNNNSYTLPNVYKDGSNTATPVNINFITSGYNGTSGSPIGIADYWIWKYANQSGSYSDWQHVRSTGSLLPGEGFTMKGVNNTSGNVSLEQNYILQGKPNNGDITLPITAGSEYLVGNPYASAIDAHQFIMDNAPTIEGAGSTTGTLYFWEHWGGGSHNLADYQGGYATYNLSGSTPAASLGTNDPLVATGGTPSKLPGRFIPVAQGFFVKSEATGTIRFNNNQRVFEKEGSNSTFVRMSADNSTANTYNSDDRLKIRLGINTVNGIHRQLLVTQDPNATSGYDWGYDGETNEAQMDDIFWMVDNNKYIIQGTDVVDVNTVLPVGIKTDNAGDNTFTIDALENVPADLDIYLHDTITSTYHDLRLADFTINLPAGEVLDRFEIVFSTPTSLSIEDELLDSGINTYYSNSLQGIVVNNPKLNTIKSVNLYNILGQHIINFSEVDNQDYIELNTGKLSTGSYIIKIETEDGKLSKKVLVE